MKTIETERLILRAIEESDAESLFEYCKLPQVGPNAGWKPHETPEETLEIMKVVFLNQESVWGIVLKESGRMIGTVGLIADPRRENPRARMLGYGISDVCWGKGYMTEAAKAVLEYGFSILDIDFVSAYCYPGNKRSKRVIEKCGFEYEGTLKLAEVRYDGAVLDNECYILLK